MGKNIKSYATTKVHSPEKGREALRQKVLNLSFKNTVRLNHTQNCTGVLNLSFKIWYGLTVHIIRFQKILQAKLSIFQNCPIKSNSSELRKFRAVRPHSPRITQNLHILLTYSILCFRHLPRQRTLENSRESREFRTLRTIIKTYVIDFQISDHRQRTQEKWSE